MKARNRRAADRRIVGWVGSAGVEAVGRLALLTGSTAVFSRLLTPRDFGVTALVLTFTAVGAVFVGMPFEEALAQRRFLRSAHLRSALGASWIIGGAILAVSALAGWALARFYQEPEFALLLPVSMVSIFFTGHTAILLALARRLRRFNDIAAASLLGHLVGVALSLILAFAGAGLWSLVANRVLISLAIAVILQMRIGFLILPRWSFAPIAELGRFAGLSFLDRLIDNLTYLVFNNVVEAIYGASVLGYVNMAMRLIEPIRGAVAATGHNLAFSFFAPVSRDRRRLGALAETVVSQSALVVAPMFVGMAAVTPVLLPLMAGPGWNDATDIAVCLAIGGAIASPPRLIFTALSASAKPEFALISTIASFVTTIVALIATSMFGPISVGLSRIAGDATRAAFAIGLRSAHLHWPRLGRLAALAPAWALSGVMGAVVALSAALAPATHKWSLLIFLVALGVVVYGSLLAVFARPTFLRLTGHLRGRGGEAIAAAQ